MRKPLGCCAASLRTDKKASYFLQRRSGNVIFLPQLKSQEHEPRTRYSSGWKYVTPSNPQLLHFELESAIVKEKRSFGSSFYFCILRIDCRLCPPLQPTSLDFHMTAIGRYYLSPPSAFCQVFYSLNSPTFLFSTTNISLSNHVLHVYRALLFLGSQPSNAQNSIIQKSSCCLTSNPRMHIAFLINNNQISHFLSGFILNTAKTLSMHSLSHFWFS
jgi:hypothetical protein